MSSYLQWKFTYQKWIKNWLLKFVYMLTIRSKSCLMNLMKFWHVESQKPARDERRWVIGMADLVFNINYVAVHFDIYKTIAFRINNRFVQKKTWLETARDRGGGGGGAEQKLTPLEERFIKTFLTATQFVQRLGTHSLWYMSIHQKRPERGGWSKYWHFVILKTSYDRHWAP